MRPSWRNTCISSYNGDIGRYDPNEHLIHVLWESLILKRTRCKCCRRASHHSEVLPCESSDMRDQLPHTHMHHRGTLTPHVQSFYVGLDDFVCWMHSRTHHTGIAIQYEQCTCVDLNSSCSCRNGHICHIGMNSLVGSQPILKQSDFIQFLTIFLLPLSN